MRLPLFDPSTDLPKDFVTIVYGKRRSGKNTMLMHMLESMKDRFEHHEVYVFSGTALCNPEQYKYFPAADVHSDISTMNSRITEIMEDQYDLILKEVKRQMGKGGVRVAGDRNKEIEKSDNGQNSRMLTRESDLEPAQEIKKPKEKESKKRSFSEINVEGKGKKKMEKQFPTTADEGAVSDLDVYEVMRSGKYDKDFLPKKLVILDDVVDSESVRNSPSLNTLAVSGRHWGFSVIILSQCICGSGSVPPIIRINSDIIITVYNPRAKQERKLLCEQYLTPSGSNEKVGIKLLGEVTRVPFRCLVIDTSNAHSQEYNDFLFTYGPVPDAPNNVSPDFEMGTEDQWKKEVHGVKKPKFDGSDKAKKPAQGRLASVQEIPESMVGDEPTFFDTLF